MEIQLYNTLSKQKQKFAPIDPCNVRMYVCGPTVYDRIHIGNARPVIVFDVLFRLLRHIYGEQHVVFARNITDVDDKINARAEQRNIPIRELTGQTIRQFHEDITALNALPPTHEPRATEHIGEMRAMISALVEKGHAYVADQHVLFHVPSMPGYGRLSKRSTEDMIAGSRVEVAPYKKDPMDFVLWKPSMDGEPGWDSEWGRGRPGWHVECSAMAGKYLGEVFDIHGGGIDLVFPHHENELAQSSCCHDTDKLANYWLHNGFLRVEGRKMAKSEGNFVTVRDLLGKWPGEAIRLALLSTHYRQPLDFTEKGLAEARHVLDGWHKAVSGVVSGADVDGEFLSALGNDLNTPDAIHVLHRLKTKATKGDRTAAEKLKSSAGLLGLLQKTEKEWLAWRPEDSAVVGDEEIGKLIAERDKARKVRDFATADRIRDELAEKGIELSDSVDGKTEWRFRSR